MKITDAFLGEHGAFYAQIEHLERTVPAAASVPDVQGQAGVLAAALATHAGLEDELLFAALEPRLGAMQGPLAVMRAEHVEIERALARAQEARTLADAQQLVVYALQVARRHFAKEEQVLFPMAERALDADTLEMLGLQWAVARGVALAMPEGL